MALKSRSEVAQEDKWNVEALYSSLDAWEKAYNEVRGSDTAPHWPAIASHRSKLIHGPDEVKKTLETLFALRQKLERLYTYAHLRHDEDISNEAYKGAYKKITALLYDFSHETAWFEPELLALSEAQITEYLDAPLLAPYKFFLEKIIRLKKHTLTHEQEELMALAGKALQAPHKAFSALNDADLKFGKVLDGKGQERELTHGSYSLCIRDQDRTLRKNSFQQFHQKYHDFEQTLCELINGQVQAHLFDARARKYSSCLEAALFPKNVDTSVYHALITAVRQNIDALHDYMALRKEILGVDQLHLYDVYVPLTASVDIRMDYRQAEEAVVDSVKLLGSEYQQQLREGLLSQRWVDRYENRNKRSGAYSSGCFGTMPYILMNYKGVLRDVFTLAHEAGHSMHSLLSRSHQPYHYSDYPIFVAEVASTFNEEMLMDLMVERATSDGERFFLINEKLEDIRGTLFRQTMFAEFELLIHQFVENGIPLTPGLLRAEYRKLNEVYMGKDVVIDSEIEAEWSRIPHFYYDFYVYQYATGISAALALVNKVRKGGAPAREAYLSFLKGGSSQFPIDLLQQAGVDMRSPEPVKEAIDTFRRLVAELRKLKNKRGDLISTQKS